MNYSTSDSSGSLRFDDRVAIITGGGAGLGRSYARLLAQRGARVVINDIGTTERDGRTVSTAELLAEEIRRDGGTAVSNQDSVTTQQGGEAMTRTAIQEFGRLDILINNAGFVRDRSFHKLDPEDLRALVDVHLMASFYVAAPAWRRMREQGYGRVVNTSSASGLFGNFGQTAYAAAKAGVVGLTRALALEVGDRDLRVNAVAPMALTQLTDGMLGDLTEHSSPDLAAPMVALLAHETNPLNGEVLSCGGGRFSRTFFAETQGYFDLQATPESVAAALPAIMSEEGYTVPRSLADVSDSILDAARREQAAR